MAAQASVESPPLLPQVVGALAQLAVPAIEPIRPHLKLGVSYNGLQRIYTELGLLNRTSCVFLQGADLVNLRQTYPPHESWIDATYPSRLTCYDVSAVVRMWNAANGTEGMSALEAFLARDAEGWAEDIGAADFFLSHVQAENPSNTLHYFERASGRETLRKIRDNPTPRGWIDLFSLRQSEVDYQIDEVLRLINHIGATLVAIDVSEIYPHGSFVLLEVYGSIVGNAEMAVDGNVLHLSRKFVVESAHAECRDEDSRELIRKYVGEKIGFDAFNRVLQRLVLEQRKKYSGRRCCMS